MCGIVGWVSNQRPVLQALMQGLSRLEYRGYDSAGIALMGAQQGQSHVADVMDSTQPINMTDAISILQPRIVRQPGMLQALAEKVPWDDPATTGIGHTRWATHGPATLENTHPHTSGHVSVVHNGIIDNFAVLKVFLRTQGYVFVSQTDTEVVAHWLDWHYQQHDGDVYVAMAHALPGLQGNFALGIVWHDHPAMLMGARAGTPPLVVGYGHDAMGLSSDPLGLAGMATHVSYVPPYTWVVLTPREVSCYAFAAVSHKKDSAPVPDITLDRKPVSVPLARLDMPASYAQVHKGSHAWFMGKEMHEQPVLIQHLLGQGLPALGDLNPAWAGQQDAQEGHMAKNPPTNDGGDVPAITLVGCGTSYYAACVGQYVLETSYPVRVERASELSCRTPVVPGGVLVALSQSGETADTLQAVQDIMESARQQAGQNTSKNHGNSTTNDRENRLPSGQRNDDPLSLISIVNVEHSTLARLGHIVLPTGAGPEIGVASTKSFVSQVAVLLALAGLRHDPLVVSHAMQAVLDQQPLWAGLARTLADARTVMFVGRGVNAVVAAEGCLKMQELAYIPCQALPAGELKHGPIALVDGDLLVIALAPYDMFFEKTLGNLHEIAARQGRLLVLTDAAGQAAMSDLGLHFVTSPHDVPSSLQAWGTGLGICLPRLAYPWHVFTTVTALQMLAYETACHLGRCIDKPRNLAKSVTVA